MMGAGKYDDLCTGLRLQTQAEGVVLIVFGGVHGSGFSLQTDMETTRLLPTLLRDVADTLEKDIASGRAFTEPIFDDDGENGA